MTDEPGLAELLSPALFKALGEPNRVRILMWLAQGRRECTVSEVAKLLPVGVSVVSRHLAALKDVGILSSERRGKEVYYRVEVERLIGLLRRIANALESCC